MTAASWWILAAAGVLAAGGYRYSLGRHPTRKCHSCGASGRHRPLVWTYAEGPCRARTLLPPRARCKGGRVPRYGRRLLKLDGKGK